jgi:hypothetical protein
MSDPIHKAYAYTHLPASLEAGVSCPACEQECKWYYRYPTGEMVRALKRLIDRVGYGESAPFLHRRKNKITPGKTDGDWAKLAYFGLIEEGEEKGYWRATERGYAFIYGGLRLPENAVVFDDHILHFCGPVIRVHDVVDVGIDLAHIFYGPKAGKWKKPPKKEEPRWRDLDEFFRDPRSQG